MTPSALSRSDRLARLDAARLYLCTDARREHGDLLEFAAAALRGGVDIIQLRDKGSRGEKQLGVLEAREEVLLLAALRKVVDAHGGLLAVNDRADIAAIAGADVLHLGQGDLLPTAARQIVGPEVIIGVSTHDTAQATEADADACVDYFCVGPCWPTPTKPGRTAPGIGLVEQVAAAQPTTPWFAIGGIDEQRLPEVLAAGARRAVVVRAITEATDATAAAAALREQLDRGGR